MAVVYNLSMDQGTDFSANLPPVKDSTNSVRSLTGFTGRAQLRKSYAATSNIEFTVNIDTPADGVVKLTLTNAVTANIKFGRYVYDLEITKTADNTIERLYEGIVTVFPEVTR